MPKNQEAQFEPLDRPAGLPAEPPAPEQPVQVTFLGPQSTYKTPYGEFVRGEPVEVSQEAAQKLVEDYRSPDGTSVFVQTA